MNNITFAIIKPDAVKNRNTGKIYDPRKSRIVIAR